MNVEVEECLHKIKFPYRVGYGMTKCAPLISFTEADCFVPKSSGQTIPMMEENRAALNNIVAFYESIAQIQLYPNEFEKTPKKSIKRYLYTTAFSEIQRADIEGFV